MAQDRVKIQRIAAGEARDRAQWLDALTRLDERSFKELKRDGATVVLRGRMVGQEVVVKRWELRTIGARLKSVWRASKAFRHVRGAERLSRAGVPVARPLVLATRGRTAEVLVMEALPGVSVLHHLARKDLSVKAEHALARTLGAQIALMTLRGVYNRDHKPSNLIVTDASDAAVEVAVIDTVDIRTAKKMKGCYRMLASLLIEPMGCGVAPRATLIARVLRSFCESWLTAVLSRALDMSEEIDRAAMRQIERATAERVGRLIDSHGDMTPAVNPLHS